MIKEKLNSLLFYKDNRIPSTLIACLFTAFLIFSSYTTLKALLTTNQKPTSTQRVTSLTTTKIPMDLASLHLFGKAQAHLPETTLALTLEGVLFILNKKQSRAIIQSQGTTKAYATGEKLPGGAVLKEIKKTSVVLESNGQLSQLKLPVRQLGNLPAA